MYRNIFLQTALIIAFTIGLHAQNPPVDYNPNVLAHSQGLPNDFLLFSPDTSVQILFNPARAGLSERRFVYVNYLSNKSRTLSVTSLFDASGSTWLLQVSNIISRSTNDYTTNSQSVSAYTYSTQIENSLNQQTNLNTSKSNSSVTSLKLSLIGGAAGNSYSLGAYGIFSPQENTYNQESNSHTERIDSLFYTSIPFSEKRKDDYRRISDDQSENSNYAAGIEYCRAGSNWDLISGIQIQKTKIQRLSNTFFMDDNQYERNDSTQSYSDKSLNSDDTKISVKTSEPIIYKAYVYFQQATDIITSTDHYFVSSNIYTSNGKIFMINVGKRTSWSQYNNNPPMNETTFKTLVDQQETNDWGIKLAMGYLVTRKLMDIDILIGLYPQIGYDEYKTAQRASWLEKRQMWSGAVQIPIYLNYTPVDWCSFFGGLNCRYTYNYQKENGSIMSQENIEYFGTPSSSESEQGSSSTLSYSDNVYAGMELRHSSGLHVQCAFNGNVSSYTNWNISLGYVY